MSQSSQSVPSSVHGDLQWQDGGTNLFAAVCAKWSLYAQLAAILWQQTTVVNVC